KTCARNQDSSVLGFEIVDVRSVSVNFGMDVVTGSMNEVIPVAGFPDHLSAGIIDLPAENLPARRKRLLHEIRGRVASVSHHVELLCDLCRHGFTDKRSPGYVRVHRAGPIEFRPQIY